MAGALFFYKSLKSGAGNETRTRDPNLGKVVLYQLSYSRVRTRNSKGWGMAVKLRPAGRRAQCPLRCGHAATRYFHIDQSVSTAAASRKP